MTAPALVPYGYALRDEYREPTKKELASTVLFVPTGRAPDGTEYGQGFFTYVVGAEARALAATGNEHRQFFYVYVSVSEYVTAYYAMATRVELDTMALLTEVKGVGAARAARLLDRVAAEQVIAHAAAEDARGLGALAKGTGFGPGACSALCSGKLAERAASLHEFYFGESSSCASSQLRGAQELRRDVEAWLGSLGMTPIEYASKLDAVSWVDYVSETGVVDGAALQSVVRDVLTKSGSE